MKQNLTMKHITDHRIIETVKPKKKFNLAWAVGVLLILTLPTAGLTMILAKSVQGLQNNGNCIEVLLERNSSKPCSATFEEKQLVQEMKTDSSVTLKIEELNKQNDELLLQIKISVLNGMSVLVVALAVGGYVLNQRFEIYDKHHSLLLSEAHTDTLTGLSNRRRFLLDLDARLECGDKYNAFFTVIFIDVDRFKHINDTYGHTVGDEILQSLATILSKTIRKEYDALGRLAGDEFAIVTGCFTNKDAAKAAAVEISGRVKRDVAKLRKKESMDLSVSVGIAMYPDDGATEKELLTAADTAMYDAKQKGQSVPFVFYDKAVHDKEKRLEAEIIDALENNGCFVEYQPKINMRTNKCVGLEALTRLVNANGDVIQPSEFIPVAERMKKMEEITKYLIDTVISDLGAFKTLPVSINISPNQLRDRYIIHYLQKKIEEGEVRENRLDIEITEQAEIQDVENMRSLGVLPITISIDDFGKGYNSLACMYKFREFVDTIKIDKEFSDNILNEQGYEVFKTIVGLARQFKYNIVVEGVETQEQMTRIAALDCDVVQGFFYSKPMRLAVAVSYIAQLGAIAPRFTPED